ncbi:MAG: thiamine phosphate synthase [Candidatus Acidiferrales bacterium]
MARLPERWPLLCYITDRKTVAGENLVPLIEQAVAAGIELIQIRERDLPAAELLRLAKTAVERARGTATRILTNDRLDVALAAAADGIHLPTHGLPVAEVRQRHSRLLIGASCHNLEELRRAEESGADFAVFGPVFATASKKDYGPPLGLAQLAAAVGAVKIPVLALGGLTRANAAECLAAGANGLAAISLFQTSPDLPELVRHLRALG